MGIVNSIRFAVLLSLIHLASTTPAHAQLCSSFAPFGREAVRLTAGPTFSDKGYGGTGGFAAGNGAVWGGGSISIHQLDARDDLSVSGAAFAGFQFPLDQNGVAQMCPVLSVSESTVRSGVAVGVVAARNGLMQLIPLATVESVYSRETAVGETTPTSDIWGTVRVKLGVVYDNVLTLRGSGDVPFGGDNVGAFSTVLLGVHFWAFR